MSAVPTSLSMDAIKPHLTGTHLRTRLTRMYSVRSQAENLELQSLTRVADELPTQSSLLSELVREEHRLQNEYDQQVKELETALAEERVKHSEG